jgi:hypothetical protein
MVANTLRACSNRSMTVCAGCLRKLRCGVCLGFGAYDAAKGVVTECHRCYGTGKCYLCREVDVADASKSLPLALDLANDALLT